MKIYQDGKFKEVKSINVFKNGEWQKEQNAYVYHNGEWMSLVEYKLMLFEEGLEHVEFNYNGSKLGDSGIKDDHINLLMTSTSGKSIVYTDHVDISSYDMLYFDCEYSIWSGTAFMGVNESFTTFPHALASKIEIDDASERNTFKVDVSDLSGDFVVEFGITRSRANSRDASAKIYNIWLE